MDSRDPRERMETQERLVHQDPQVNQEYLVMLVPKDSRVVLDFQETMESQWANLKKKKLQKWHPLHTYNPILMHMQKE